MVKHSGETFRSEMAVMESTKQISDNMLRKGHELRFLLIQ